MVRIWLGHFHQDLAEGIDVACYFFPLALSWLNLDGEAWFSQYPVLPGRKTNVECHTLVLV